MRKLSFKDEIKVRFASGKKFVGERTEDGVKKEN